MKELILLLLLLPSLLFAQDWQEARMSLGIVAGGVPAAVVNTDSCTSGLLFSWHCENVDVTLGGIAGGVNNGCSVGDTTAALTTAILDTDVFSDGIKSLHWSAVYNDARFAVSTYDIVKYTAGTITFDVYFHTLTNGSGALCVVDTSEYLDGLRVNLVNVLDMPVLRFTHLASGKNATINTSYPISIDTWYTVTVKWQQTGDPNLYIRVVGAGYDQSATENTDQGNPAASWIFFLIGTSGIAADTHVDNIKIYNSYL